MYTNLLDLSLLNAKLLFHLYTHIYVNCSFNNACVSVCD